MRTTRFFPLKSEKAFGKLTASATLPRKQTYSAGFPSVGSGNAKAVRFTSYKIILTLSTRILIDVFVLYDMFMLYYILQSAAAILLEMVTMNCRCNVQIRNVPRGTVCWHEVRLYNKMTPAGSSI